MPIMVNNIKNKLPERNEIPEAVKRLARQHDGFGCCKCGNPIIQYHHILPRSEDPNDIMLLCPLHHDEASSFAMAIEEQVFLKKNPYNIINKRVNGILKINQTSPVISIGSVQFIGDSGIIVIDNECLLSIGIDNSASYNNIDRLTISVKLYDADDQLLARIDDNEWVSGDPKPWDIIAKWQYLKISRHLGDISLEINAKKDPIKIKGHIWRKKQHIILSDAVHIANGDVITNSIYELCLVGMSIDIDTSTKTLSLKPFSKTKKAALVSEPNRKKRIRKGLHTWNELNKKS
jgi:hypothetical protein